MILGFISKLQIGAKVDHHESKTEPNSSIIVSICALGIFDTLQPLLGTLALVSVEK
jgi:hypothetical protein